MDWDGVVRAMSEGETTITCSVQEGSLEAGFSPDNKNPYITVSCTIKVEGVGDNTELDKIEWKYTDNKNGTATLTGYNKSGQKVPSGQVTIPRKVGENHLTVTDIGYQAFYQQRF